MDLSAAPIGIGILLILIGAGARKYPVMMVGFIILLIGVAL